MYVDRGKRKHEVKMSCDDGFDERPSSPLVGYASFILMLLTVVYMSLNE